MGDIYYITCAINDRGYVGETINTIADRWSHHKASALRGSNDCPALYNAIRYHGVESFKIEKIYTAATRKELDEAEIRFIAELGTLVPNGYNISKGGQLSHEHIEETKQKISSSLRINTDPDVPMYIIRHKRNGCDGFIVAYPGKKKAYFTSIRHSLDENLNLAKEHLIALKEGRDPPPITRDRYCIELDRTLPVGVSYSKTNGRLQVLVSCKGGKNQIEYFTRCEGQSIDDWVKAAIDCRIKAMANKNK